MEQKLFNLNIHSTLSNKEIVFPDKLQELINDGWYIKEMSVYHRHETAAGLTLLLQKD